MFGGEAPADVAGVALAGEAVPAAKRSESNTICETGSSICKKRNKSLLLVPTAVAGVALAGEAVPVAKRSESNTICETGSSTCRKRNRSHTQTHNKNNTTQDTTRTSP